MNWNATTSTASDQAKVKRRRHRKPGKDIVYRCLVCEDVALNYNFTVITCESCKAFFRRNVDTPNRFHCPNHFACKVSKQTRKHCPACRLKKCFDVGMRKEILPNMPGGSSCGDEQQLDQDVKSNISSDAVVSQYVEAMSQAAAINFACASSSRSVFAAPKNTQHLDAATASQMAGAQILAMMSAANAYPAVDWRNPARSQLDNVATQLGGVALSGGVCRPVPVPVSQTLRPSTFDSPGPVSSTRPETPPPALRFPSATCGESSVSSRADVEPASPAPLSSPASVCTLPLHSPFGAFAEQGAGQSNSSAVSSLPIKHRLKRLRSPTGNHGVYESPASNASSVSSAVSQPVNSSSSSQSYRGLRVPVLSGCSSASSHLEDSPSASSVVFDRDGACASAKALLSADEFKQALEMCTRFSTMMQAPFSTAELGALLSNPLPENAFESSVYVELALRRYVHSLKRLGEFARLDKSWQLFVLRRALITAHSVNVGFYIDVDRRAFICPREDGSCLYLNEAYFYRTFEKRAGSHDIYALMKPLMGFHVSLQQEFSTQWTIVLSAMSLAMLFSTHFYQSTAATPASSVSPREAPKELPIGEIIQQIVAMTGLKLPPDFDLSSVSLESLAQLCPGVDLQAITAMLKQLGDAGAASGGLEAFGPSPPPAGLLEALEPLHRKYLYFLHDYVLMLHSSADRAVTAWRFCSEKLEEVRRVADVFTQQAFLFIAQNPQLGGLLVPLLNEIISSTPP